MFLPHSIDDSLCNPTEEHGMLRQTVRELGPFYLVAFGVLALVSYVPFSIVR